MLRPLHDDEGMHHVVFFVFEDVTVPDVFGASDAVTGLQPRAGRTIREHVEGGDNRRDLAGIEVSRKRDAARADGRGV